LDGGERAPKVFAVKDLGTSGQLLWTYDIPTNERLISSINKDPRGGIWFYPRPIYGRLTRLDEHNGNLIEEIDYSALVNAANPVGINTSTTIFSKNGQTYMSFGVTPSPPTATGQSFLVVLNLDTRSIHFKYKLSDNALNFLNAGSAPRLTVEKNAKTRLVAGTTNFGVMCFGNISEDPNDPDPPTPDPPTSRAKAKGETLLRLYVSPGTLSYPTGSTLQLYNLQGRRLLDVRLDGAPQVAVDTLIPSVYLARVLSPGGTLLHTQCLWLYN
jgi:hypothetical protein